MMRLKIKTILSFSFFFERESLISTLLWTVKSELRREEGAWLPITNTILLRVRRGVHEVGRG